MRRDRNSDIETGVNDPAQQACSGCTTHRIHRAYARPRCTCGSPSAKDWTKESVYGGERQLEANRQIMEDPILFWNQVALEANRIDHTGGMEGEHQAGPTRSSRAIAIVHLAMHDGYFGVAGVAAIPGPAVPAKRLYLAAPPGYTGGDSAIKRSAAVSGAASTALMTLYSSQHDYIESKAAEIAGVNGTDDTAFSFGRKVALAVFETRRGDGSISPNDEDHVASPGVMRHRKDPFNPGQPYLGVAHGKMKTFAVRTWQPLSAPPNKASTEYKDNLKEVWERGGDPSLGSTSRKPEQTAIGLFWAYDGPMRIGTPPRLYNQIVREVAVTKRNTPEDNARLFALVNCAMGDSGIHAWHYKYCYDLWRPVVGIREDDKSTGPTAVADKEITAPCDPFWKPLGAPRSNEPKPDFTPPFPAYPSGHATFGAAAFEMVRRFYRNRDGLPFKDDEEDAIGFELVSDELNGVTTGADGAVRIRHRRKYDSMAEAIYDNSVSRIFLGVHWRFDGTSGNNVKQMLKASDNIGGVPLGRAIAKDIFTSGMQEAATPPTPPSAGCI